MDRPGNIILHFQQTNNRCPPKHKRTTVCLIQTCQTISRSPTMGLNCFVFTWERVFTLVHRGLSRGIRILYYHVTVKKNRLINEQQLNFEIEPSNGSWSGVMTHHFSVILIKSHACRKDPLRIWKCYTYRKKSIEKQ